MRQYFMITCEKNTTSRDFRLISVIRRYVHNLYVCRKNLKIIWIRKIGELPKNVLKFAGKMNLNVQAKTFGFFWPSKPCYFTIVLFIAVINVKKKKAGVNFLEF